MGKHKANGKKRKQGWGQALGSSPSVELPLDIRHAAKRRVSDGVEGRGGNINIIRLATRATINNFDNDRLAIRGVGDGSREGDVAFGRGGWVAVGQAVTTDLNCPNGAVHGCVEHACGVQQLATRNKGAANRGSIGLISTTRPAVIQAVGDGSSERCVRVGITTCHDSGSIVSQIAHVGLGEGRNVAIVQGVTDAKKHGIGRRSDGRGVGRSLLRLGGPICGLAASRGLGGGVGRRRCGGRRRGCRR